MDKNNFFDDLGKLIDNAAGVADGVRREIETAVKSQVERFVNDLDLVKREDFDVVREMVQIQEEELVAMRKELDTLKKQKKS